jgi:phthiocerol/phenolphthiocerol synthesis type-I polyketide synthase D
MNDQPTFPTTRKQVEDHLRIGLADALGVAPDAVASDKAFAAFGLDSIKAFALTGDLAEWLDKELPATLFWDHPNIEALTTHITNILGIEQ